MGLGSSGGSKSDIKVDNYNGLKEQKKKKKALLCVLLQECHAVVYMHA